MKKWKLLFVNGFKCKKRFLDRENFLNISEDEANILVLSGIVLRSDNSENLMSYT